MKRINNKHRSNHTVIDNIKWLLSVISGVLTTGLVVVLEA